MPGTLPSVDYRTDRRDLKTVAQPAGAALRPVTQTGNSPPSADGVVDTQGDSAAIGDFLQSLSRAVRQFRTYPATSPLCADAIGACHKIFSMLERERLTLRVTPTELMVDEVGFGAGTVVEQELVRRLHKARIAMLEIDRGASLRDLSCFCTDLVRCGESAHAKTTLAELLTEDGVDAVVPMLAHRPEVLAVGTPPASVCDLIERERTRRQAGPADAGPVNYLYPPDKGWVRLDPSTSFDAVSLVDLAVLVDDPSEVASMLLRLTDDDPVGPVGPEARGAALQQKFSDVAMLFAALDPRLARVMFGKLARAVMALEPERRNDLLRRTILPGLLDGRVDGTVLRDFADPDLAESLCLLLDLEAAAPEIVATALDRLGLPEERRETVLPLVDERLRARKAGEADARGNDLSVERYAKRLIRVEAPGKNFAEFSAFDLSIDEQAAAFIASVSGAIDATDVPAVQLQCLWGLVRLEPNPTVVSALLDRASPLLGDLEREARWPDLAAWITKFRQLAESLQEKRPDVTTAIVDALAAFCTPARAIELANLHERDAAGKQVATMLVEAFGPALVPAFVSALEDASFQSKIRPLVPLMCANAELFAPALAADLGRYGVVATRTIVKVLGFAGGGYETAIAAQLRHHDAQVGREALRALARIGSAQAGAIVVRQLQGDNKAAQSAAEEALWHFPPQQLSAQLRELLGRRDFVLRQPQMVVRLLDRAANAGASGLEPILRELASLKFRLWTPAVARVGRKAEDLLKP
jgi:hypothetical protein